VDGPYWFCALALRELCKGLLGGQALARWGTMEGLFREHYSSAAQAILLLLLFIIIIIIIIILSKMRR